MKLISQFPTVEFATSHFPTLGSPSHTATALNLAADSWRRDSSVTRSELDRIDAHVRATIRTLIDADSALSGALSASH